MLGTGAVTILGKMATFIEETSSKTSDKARGLSTLPMETFTKEIL
jgi:hypothetical protein